MLERNFMDISREIYLHFFASDDKIKATLWANAIFSSKTKPKYYADESSAKSNLLSEFQLRLQMAVQSQIYCPQLSKFTIDIKLGSE